MKRHIIAAFGSIILAVVVYVGMYYAMLDEPLHLPMGRDDEVIVLPRYRLMNGYSVWLFGAAHEIDRKIRPTFWGE